MAQRKPPHRQAPVRESDALELLARELFVAIVGQTNHHSMSKEHLATLSIEYAAAFYTTLDRLNPEK